ncbi:MAG: CBS domain-containing protein [Planctomycetaceae bacterium]|nr:CBS domain-containing protein [Planctomycetaceae bacterium]
MESIQLTVRQIMQTDVQTIGPHKSLAVLQSSLVKANVSGLPVVNSGQLVGIASRSDIVASLQSEREKAMRQIGLPPEVHLTTEDAMDLGDVIGEQLERIRVEQIMKREIVSVAPDDSIRFAAELLASNHIHRLPVVDGGHLVGLIASHDLVRLIANETYLPAVE